MSTKPEGPAQERETYDWCPDCGQTHVLEHGCPVPATPAPSQPAGARELLQQTSFLWQSKDESWFKRNEERIVLFAEEYARQQTAAKDTEIATLKREHALADLRTAEEQDAREAAERERDSLRESAKYWCRLVEAGEREIERLRRERTEEQLKAGKG